MVKKHLPLILTFSLGLFLGALALSQRSNKTQETSPTHTIGNVQPSATSAPDQNLIETATIATPEPSLPPATTKIVLHEEQKFLNSTELNQYLKQMHISQLTLPASAGRPILNVDWDVNSPITGFKSDSGRMISLGLENFHSWGIRWGAINIIYSTYDFAHGTEYSVYAKKSDYEKLKAGEYTAALTLDGHPAVVNYQLPTFYDGMPIQKIVTIPFENHYVAFVYHFHEGPYNNNQTLTELYQGKVPPQEENYLKTFDEVVGSVRFSE